jgi:hypothetical protein
MAKPFLAAAMLIAMALLIQPAAAQVTFGSPGEPMRVALGAGAFDITPDHPPGTQGLFDGEFHFGDVLWIVSPFVGAQVSTKGSTYLYGGFGFDINFGPNFVLTPNGAVGWYQHGSGTVLGSSTEFRTGAEFDYKFADLSRLGISFHHISNAGIGKFNPGEQQIQLVYQLPLSW